MDAAIRELVASFMEALRDQNAAVFAGAGLSMPAGFVNWKELMRSVAEDLGLDIDREHDLIALAQYHKNERRSRHRINQLLIRELTRDVSITENHRILARLPIQTFWTTNYDRLIERALENAGKTADVKMTPENLATNVPRRHAVVYKMHGDVSLPDQAVVTKDDYESYNQSRQLFSTALQGDLVSKTFLFLGFSFSDPNLDYILSRIRVLLGENRRDHYCVMRRVQRRDFPSQSEYVYAKTKQELQINDLRRYGIIGVLLDDYDQVTEVLKQVERRSRASCIFISGSAEVYDPYREVEARLFIENLAGQLVERGFNLVSGFGHDVGSAVINGVLRQLDAQRSSSLADWLTLRPFPQQTENAETRRRRWRRYREEMMARAGIALFLFGNKRNQSGAVAIADGVLQEFEIAVEQGLAVIPVGATGFASDELHKRVSSDFPRYFGQGTGLARQFRALGNNKLSLQQLRDRTVEFVTSVRDKQEAAG